MNHEISEEFSSEIRKFESTDRASADVLNEPIGILVNNDAYLKKALEILDIRCAQTSLQITQECAASKTEAKEYTDAEIEKLVDDAPFECNTLGKLTKQIIGAANSTSQSIMALQNEIDSIWTSKASHSDITGENLIPYPYVNKTTENRNGVAWTDLGNGHVKANGTASVSSDFYLFHDDVKLEAGTYTISGMPEQDPSTIYIFLNWYKAGAYEKTTLCKGTTTFTLTESDISTYTFRLGLRVTKDVTANNAIFKPMLEKGTVAHSFQPYNLSRKGITEQIVVDNLLPYPYFETSHTHGDVVFTDKGDGTITANGTASANSSFEFRSRIETETELWLEPGTYTISGCPLGGHSSKYRIWVGTVDTSTNQATYLCQDIGSGATFTLTDRTKLAINISIVSGTTVSNLIFKPMLEVGTVAHPYQPYTRSRDGIIEQIVAENLLIYPYFEKTKTHAGITYTVNSDGSVDASGKSTGSFYIYRTRGTDYTPLILPKGTYVISGCPKGGSLNTYCLQISKNGADGSHIILNYDFGDGAVITLTEDTQIQIGIVVSANCPELSNLKFYAMVEKGTIAHPYQPYTKSRDGIIEQIVVDNLLEFPYYNNSMNLNGVDFTVNNEDGTVTANGTATANTSFIFTHRIDNKVILSAGAYTVSGCPKGGSANSYHIQIGKTENNSFYLIGRDIGNGFTFTLTEDTDIYIAFYVPVGVTVSNLLIKPMLERGTVAHPYQPYNLSRQGLVEQIVAENLIEYPYKQPYNTTNGITWSKNDESGMVIANGTATNHSQYYFNQETTLGMKPNETYTLSGFPKGVSKTSAFRLRIILNFNEEGTVQYSDIGEGVTFTTPSNFKHCRIMVDIPKDTTVSNLVIKPMLEKGCIAHPYTEYRKSLSKLREDLDTLMEDTGWITLAEAGEYSNFTVDEAISYRVIRNKLYIAGTVSFSGAESSLGAMANLGTLPSDIIIPHSIEKAFAHNLSSTVVAVFSVQINLNGYVILAMSKNTTNNSASLYKKYFEECILLD